MAIKRPPTRPSSPSSDGDAVIDTFVNAAPDGGRLQLTEVEEMTQITLRISKPDLATIDQAAKVRRISRASFIRQAVFKTISEELS